MHSLNIQTMSIPMLILIQLLHQEVSARELQEKDQHHRDTRGREWTSPGHIPNRGILTSHTAADHHARAAVPHAHQSSDMMPPSDMKSIGCGLALVVLISLGVTTYRLMAQSHELQTMKRSMVQRESRCISPRHICINPLFRICRRDEAELAKEFRLSPP